MIPPWMAELAAEDVDGWPPLTEDQRRQLGLILRADPAPAAARRKPRAPERPAKAA